MSSPLRPNKHRIMPPKSLVQRAPKAVHTPESQPLSNRIIQNVRDKKPLTANDVMVLQRTVGNQAVQRLLEERNALPAKSEGISRSLSSDVRAKMEHSFGASFGDVRIHQGDQADAVGARAYAQGEDIYVQRKINLNGYEGQKLLAHELAHVMQQRSGRVANPEGGPAINDNPQLETEAQRAADKAANGAPAGVHAATTHVQRTTTNVIQRSPDWWKKLKKTVSGKGNKGGGAKPPKTKKPPKAPLTEKEQEYWQVQNGLLQGNLEFMGLGSGKGKGNKRGGAKPPKTKKPPKAPLPEEEQKYWNRENESMDDLLGYMGIG